MRATTNRRRGVAAAMAAAILATGFGALGQARADDFLDQPDGRHSNITCTPTADPHDAESLVDRNFAAALYNALGDDGFHSMVMTFGQCFGGGIMDDVAEMFGLSSQPISMTSASTYKQKSWSTTLRWRQGGNTFSREWGFSDWAQIYQEAHPGIDGAGVNNNPTEGQAYRRCKNHQTWSDRSTSQQLTMNGGADIKIGSGVNGSGATSYHAILFAGNTDGRPDYWNDIVRQHEMLTRAGYHADDIAVLYDNGLPPGDAVEPPGEIPIDGAATRRNLLDTIAALRDVMNENEQLYIYIGDHGSADTGGDTQEIPPVGTKDNSNTFQFEPLDDYLIEALDAPENTSGPYVELNVTATDGLISSNWEVLFNDQPVNYGDNVIPGGTAETSVRFLIDPATVDWFVNDLWIRNAAADGDAPITVELFFAVGDLNTATSPLRRGGARAVEGQLAP